MRKVPAIAAPILVLGLLSAAGRAEAAEFCGGAGDMKTAPVDCVSAPRVLKDGAFWAGHFVVDASGNGSVTFDTTAHDADTYVEVEIHYGISGNGGTTVTGTLPAGATSVTLPFSIPMANLAPFDCVSQIDAKAINGERQTANNRVRVLGPVVRFENCAPVDTTTTAPTTTPNVQPTSTAAASVAGVTLPATGNARDDLAGMLFLGITLVAAGAGIVWRTRKGYSD